MDEAGRGPLAGPVYAAAVILSDSLPVKGLNDSKKLTAAARERLYFEIIEKALYAEIFSVDNRMIDEINILQATFKAMAGAVLKIKMPPRTVVLIDGNKTIPGFDGKQKAVIKGDAKSANIAAASILAKVSRDRFMTEAAKKYPQYGFAENKGYGTKEHMKAIKKHGTCPLHRISFNMGL